MSSSPSPLWIQLTVAQSLESPTRPAWTEVWDNVVTTVDATTGHSLRYAIGFKVYRQSLSDIEPRFTRPRSLQRHHRRLVLFLRPPPPLSLVPPPPLIPVAATVAGAVATCPYPKNSSRLHIASLSDARFKQWREVFGEVSAWGRHENSFQARFSVNVKLRNEPVEEQ